LKRTREEKRREEKRREEKRREVRQNSVVNVKEIDYLGNVGVDRSLVIRNGLKGIYEIVD
jgi:hypothetical protein